MPINPAFTINAIPQINPAAIALVDTSTGSDGNIASRQVFIYKTDNSLLIPLVVWSYAQGTLTITPLTQDVAVNIVVNWLDGANNILYTTSQIYVFTGYGEQFMYQLTQRQTSSPQTVNDTNYYDNKMQMRCDLDAATQAINVGSDIQSAQALVDRVTYMINNSQYYF